MSGTTQVCQYQKGKTNLDLLEQKIVSGSGISWAICKSIWSLVCYCMHVYFTTLLCYTTALCQYWIKGVTYLLTYLPHPRQTTAPAPPPLRWFLDVGWNISVIAVCCTFAPARSNIFAYSTVRCTSSNMRILHVIGIFSSLAHWLTAINTEVNVVRLCLLTVMHVKMFIRLNQNWLINLFNTMS